MDAGRGVRDRVEAVVARAGRGLRLQLRGTLVQLIREGRCRHAARPAREGLRAAERHADGIGRVGVGDVVGIGGILRIVQRHRVLGDRVGDQVPRSVVLGLVEEAPGPVVLRGDGSLSDLFGLAAAHLGKQADGDAGGAGAVGVILIHPDLGAADVDQRGVGDHEAVFRIAALHGVIAADGHFADGVNDLGRAVGLILGQLHEGIGPVHGGVDGLGAHRRAVGIEGHDDALGAGAVGIAAVVPGLRHRDLDQLAHRGVDDIIAVVLRGVAVDRSFLDGVGDLIPAAVEFRQSREAPGPAVFRGDLLGLRGAAVGLQINNDRRGTVVGIAAVVPGFGAFDINGDVGIGVGKGDEDVLILLHDLDAGGHGGIGRAVGAAWRHDAAAGAGVCDRVGDHIAGGRALGDLIGRADGQAGEDRLIAVGEAEAQRRAAGAAGAVADRRAVERVAVGDVRAQAGHLHIEGKALGAVAALNALCEREAAAVLDRIGDGRGQVGGLLHGAALVDVADLIAVGYVLDDLEVERRIDEQIADRHGAAVGQAGVCHALRKAQSAVESGDPRRHLGAGLVGIERHGEGEALVRIEHFPDDRLGDDEAAVDVASAALGVMDDGRRRRFGRERAGAAGIADHVAAAVGLGDGVGQAHGQVRRLEALAVAEVDRGHAVIEGNVAVGAGDIGQIDARVAGAELDPDREAAGVVAGAAAHGLLDDQGGEVVVRLGVGDLRRVAAGALRVLDEARIALRVDSQPGIFMRVVGLVVEDLDRMVAVGVGGVAVQSALPEIIGVILVMDGEGVAPAPVRELRPAGVVADLALHRAGGRHILAALAGIAAGLVTRVIAARVIADVVRLAEQHGGAAKQGLDAARRGKVVAGRGDGRSLAAVLRVIVGAAAGVVARDGQDGDAARAARIACAARAGGRGVQAGGRGLVGEVAGPAVGRVVKAGVEAADIAAAPGRTCAAMKRSGARAKGQFIRICEPTPI